jgi:hypothetical protein
MIWNLASRSAELRRALWLSVQRWLMGAVLAGLAVRMATDARPVGARSVARANPGARSLLVRHLDALRRVLPGAA